MVDFSTIFSSRAKYLVLRVLSAQSEPLPLRHVALLAGVPVFSVQGALAQLVKQKVIRRAKKKRYVLFSLKEDCVETEFIKKIFEIERDINIRERSKTYSEKAKSVLEFSDEIHEIFKSIRKAPLKS